MKKTAILFLITTILGIFTLKPIKSNSTLRGKISSLLNYNSSYSPKRKVKIPSPFKEKAGELIKSGNLSGTDSREFDYSNLSQLVSVNHYYQNKDNDGTTTTLISCKKPIVSNIDNNKVLTTYFTEENETKTLVTEGFPMWLRGFDIYYEDSKNKNKQHKKIETSSLLDNLHGESSGFSEVTLSSPISNKLNKSKLKEETLYTKSSNINNNSDSEPEESIGLISGETNEQKKNDYKALVGKGLINYGFEDK